MEKAQDVIEQLQEKLASAEFLIKAVGCPHCDGSGAIPTGDVECPDWEMCQWCYTKAKHFPDGDELWNAPDCDLKEFDLPF